VVDLAAAGVLPLSFVGKRDELEGPNVSGAKGKLCNFTDRETGVVPSSGPQAPIAPSVELIPSI
jgi:hypothetical protein